METGNKTSHKKHHGQNFKRLRQAMGIKQDAIATELNITQQAVSSYEQKAEIDEEMLKKMAKVLNVSVELIKELEADPATIVIENNTFENSNVGYSIEDCDTIYHPVDKIIELSDEKEALLERLLKVEQERNAELRQELLSLKELKEEVAELKKMLEK